MNQTFSDEKRAIIKILNNILLKLENLEKRFNVDFKDTKIKINTAISNLENERFSIAFFGAFSDGKSTILSALTNIFDIKISPAPSTDAISEYCYGDYLLIDTPGLFSEHQIHDIKTKSKISEANVIVFTVSPTNPLKESHHLTIKWLFKDLAKSDSTIFVINKMDEVADITDEEDFIHNCEIKKTVVKNTLREILGYEIDPIIVCIAADPLGRGLKYWFSDEKIEEYYKLSRLNNLEEILHSFILKSKDDLIKKAGISVITESIVLVSNKLKNLVGEINRYLEINLNQRNELSRRLNFLEKKVSENYINIKEELLRFRELLQLQIEKSKDIRELRNFYIREIGEDAHIFKEKIDLIIKKHLNNIDQSISSIEQQIDYSVKFHEEMQSKILNSISQIGAKFGEKIVNTSTKSVINKLFEIRRNSEILRNLIKFKTGGEAMKWATNWAAKIKIFGKILRTLPIITESIGIIIKIWTEYKFNKEKSSLSSEISNIFRELLDSFTEENFEETFFPLIKNIREMIEELERSRIYLQELSDIAKSNLEELEKMNEEIGRNFYKKN